MPKKKQKIKYKALLRSSYILPFALAYGISGQALACSGIVTGELGNYEEFTEIILDREEIDAILLHSGPYLHPDRVTVLNNKVEGELSAGDTLIAEKDIHMDLIFVPYHFPNNPIMPGNDIAEALAQAAGLLAMQSLPQLQNTGKLTFLRRSSIDVRNKVVPRPNTTFPLYLKAEFLKAKRGIYFFKCTAYLGSGEIVAEQELVATLGSL